MTSPGSGKKGKGEKRNLRDGEISDSAVTPRTRRTRKDGGAQVPIAGVEDEEFEGVDHKIEGVGKEIKAVGKEIKAVGKEIEGVDVSKKIEAVEQKIEGVDQEQKIEGVDQEQKIEGVDVGKKIEAVDPKIEAVDQKIEAVDQKIEAVDQKIEALDQRTEAVEQKIERVDQKIEGVEQDIKAVGQKIEAVDQKIEAVDQDIEAVDQKIEEPCSDPTEKTRLLNKKGKLETVKGKLETDKHELRTDKRQLEIANHDLRTRSLQLETEKHDLRTRSLQLETEKHDLRTRSLQLQTLKERLLERDVKIGDTLSAEHNLSKFVACLRNQELQKIIKYAEAGSLIKLPEGVLWLGDESTFTNELYVRPCYLELLEAKGKYFELRKVLNAVVYTGTPGIGKSHMCAFVIAQKLIEGKTVYFEKAIAKEFFKLELEGGVRQLENMRGLQLVQEKATAVYIVDGGSPSILQSPVESQIFASPSESLFKPETKVWSSWLYLYTPLFDLAELCKCRETVSAFKKVITQEDVEAWFLVAGGVARTVLKAASTGTSLESWKAKVLSTAQSLDEKALKQMLAGLRGSTFVPGSDSLFHWHVEVKYVGKSSSTSPDKQELRRFKRKMLHFASDWVANIIYLTFRLDCVLKVVSSIMSHNGEVETSALRGYWFETVSNMILSGGGTFQCRWLDTGDEFKLTLPVSRLYTYKSREDASVACKNDLSVYCVPSARNEVAIDAMSSPYLFFQMASGAKHTINTELSKLLEALNDKCRFTPEASIFVKSACDPPRMDLVNPVFVFCTTPTHFKNDFKTNQNIVSKGKAVVHGPILQQAVLEVPIDFVERQLIGQVDLTAVMNSRSVMNPPSNLAEVIDVVGELT